MRGIERKAILEDDTDREDFIERHSSLLQEMDADAIGRYRSLSAVIAAACRYLGIEEKELARRFNVDRSAIIRARQRTIKNPELLSATKSKQ